MPNSGLPLLARIDAAAQLVPDFDFVLDEFVRHLNYTRRSLRLRLLQAFEEASEAEMTRRTTNTSDSKMDARNAVDAAKRSRELSTRASTAAQKDVKRSSSG